MDPRLIKSNIEEKWREIIFKACVVIVIASMILEIGSYVIEAANDGLFLEPGVYRIRFIYIPLVANWIGIILTYFNLNSQNRSKRVKNAWAASLLVFVFTNLMMVHYVYAPLLCIPVIGILLATVFSDRALLLGLSIYSVLAQVVAYFEGYNELRMGDGQLLSDTGIAVATIVVGYFAGRMIIKLNAEHIEKITMESIVDQELENSVKIDPLMNINNKTTIRDFLSDQIRKYEKENPMAILIIDIDDFRLVNDEFGYQKGDEVLVKLAELVKNFDEPDIVPFKYGGEEILVFLGNRNEEQAKATANKLLEQAREIKYSFAPDRTITFSGGLQMYEEGVPFGQWIALADSKLFTAKKNGKNHIDF